MYKRQPGIQYAYNYLNQLTRVTDASGSRTITYTPYIEPDTDSITIGLSLIHILEDCSPLISSSIPVL